MSLFRARLALRPILRAPAPTLTRGIRNYDVNTPVEPIADKMQGTEAPDINNEQAAKAGKYESAEDQAFARAEENVMKNGGGKDAGEINKRDVDLAQERDADKVSVRFSIPLCTPLRGDSGSGWQTGSPGSLVAALSCRGRV